MKYVANPVYARDWFKKHNTPAVKAQMQQWIEALESGEYRQDGYYLQTLHGHCCLGVAIDACSINYPRIPQGLLRGTMPRLAYGAPEWLVDIAEVRFTAKSHEFILAELNDRRMLNFKEIALILKENFLQKMGDAC